MKSRSARLGALLIPVMALMASVAPPASANVVGAVVVVGTVNFGAGMSYPCMGNGAPDLNKCPPPIDDGQGPNQAHIGTTFTGTGVGALVKVNKPTKCATPGVCFEAGTFNITAAGTVLGQCGISNGTFTGIITPSIAVGTKATASGVNIRTFFASHLGVGGLLILNGTATNQTDGSRETLNGVLVAAVPNVSGGHSCTNKAAKQFLMAGVVLLTRP